MVVRKGLTPLIGREHEIGLLRERWERVKDGTGQIVLLSGEPGIGKSRLVEALKETIEREGARCLELRCSPYAQNSALQPVIEHLQRKLQFRLDDSAEEKLRKLERRGAQRSAPLQAENISHSSLHCCHLPHPRASRSLLSVPRNRKRRLTKRWWHGCVRGQATAMTYAWEDLHWADPSTLELLTLFLGQVPTTRLLAVFTYRPEFLPPWGAHSYLSQLTLSRLGRSHVEMMVEKVRAVKCFLRRSNAPDREQDGWRTIVCGGVDENRLGVCWVHRVLLSLEEDLVRHPYTWAFLPRCKMH